MDHLQSPEPGSGMDALTRHRLEQGSRLASELDPRLADVWSMVFGLEGEPTLEQLGWFLRMAYLNGYEDGLTETTRGALLQALGLVVQGCGSDTARGGASQ